MHTNPEQLRLKLEEVGVDSEAAENFIKSLTDEPSQPHESEDFSADTVYGMQQSLMDEPDSLKKAQIAARIISHKLDNALY